MGSVVDKINKVIYRDYPFYKGVKPKVTERGDELLLVEKWKDAGAIDEHGRQPHYVRLKALKADYVTDTVIERFETAD